MLAIGMSLMTKPKTLLLISPRGLAPLVTEELFRTIQKLTRRGSPLCSWSRTPSPPGTSPPGGYVVENGRIVLDGIGRGTLSEEDVREFHLGSGRARKEESYKDAKRYKRRKRRLRTSRRTGKTSWRLKISEIYPFGGPRYQPASPFPYLRG